MKCEICHEKDAVVAIDLVGDSDDDEVVEVYVCKDCAEKEKKYQQYLKKKKTIQHLEHDGAEMTVIASGDGVPPPFIQAIINAFEGSIQNMNAAGKANSDKDSGDSGNGSITVPGKVEPELVYKDLPIRSFPVIYRVANWIHLEGLFLIGEIPAVKRSIEALKMRLIGIDSDGLNDVGHVYRMEYSGSEEQAKRVLDALLEQEHNARVRLLDEMPRVYGDSVNRALSILKNCRLLSPGELFDMLSSLRLAAIDKLLNGMTRQQIDRMMQKLDLGSTEDHLCSEERDRIDAERADEINNRFLDVALNDEAKGKFII